MGWVRNFTSSKTGVGVAQSQQTGRVFNPDIADQVNTIQKMSQKRSLVGAVLLAVNASEFFTQDVEDMHFNATAVARETAADPDEEIRAALPGEFSKKTKLARRVHRVASTLDTAITSRGVNKTPDDVRRLAENDRRVLGQRLVGFPSGLGGSHTRYRK